MAKSRTSWTCWAVSCWRLPRKSAKIRRTNRRVSASVEAKGNSTCVPAPPGEARSGKGDKKSAITQRNRCLKVRCATSAANRSSSSARQKVSSSRAKLGQARKARNGGGIEILPEERKKLMANSRAHAGRVLIGGILAPGLPQAGKIIAQFVASNFEQGTDDQARHRIDSRKSCKASATQ